MKATSVTTLAHALHRFFSDYLPEQKALSFHTLHSYRDSLKLLLKYAAGKNQDPAYRQPAAGARPDPDPEHAALSSDCQLQLEPDRHQRHRLQQHQHWRPPQLRLGLRPRLA